MPFICGLMDGSKKIVIHRVMIALQISYHCECLRGNNQKFPVFLLDVDSYAFARINNGSVLPEGTNLVACWSRRSQHANNSRSSGATKPVETGSSYPSNTSLSRLFPDSSCLGRRQVLRHCSRILDRLLLVFEAAQHHLPRKNPP